MIEDVIKKIEETLQAQLPAAMDAVDARFNDGIVLRDIPNANYFMGRRTLRDWKSYPSVFLLGEETDGANKATSKREFKHVVHVAVTEEDINPETLQKRMWRYVEAIENVLNSDPSLGNTVIESEIFRHDYSGNMVKDGSSMEHDASASLRILERISM